MELLAFKRRVRISTIHAKIKAEIAYLCLIPPPSSGIAPEMKPLVLTKDEA